MTPTPIEAVSLQKMACIGLIEAMMGDIKSDKREEWENRLSRAYKFIKPHDLSSDIQLPTKRLSNKL